ncbi:MAG: hypothetical protein QOH67_1093, partial [Hyphomicrobiales bacterium]|nr:hypothetical protein [Hyphomicrobiales bacterium]
MRAPPWVLAMADSEIPRTMGDAILKFLWNSSPFIFVLLALERGFEGHLWQAASCLIAFIINLLIVLKWDYLIRVVGSRKMTLFWVLLAVVSALVLGIAIGKLVGRVQIGNSTAIVTPTIETGRIAWNFEEAARGLGYFLGFHRQGNEEVRISGFAAHGRNTSDDPITSLKGYVRSDITNQQFLIYVMAEDPNRPSDPFA